MSEINLTAELSGRLKKYSAEIQKGTRKAVDAVSEDLKVQLRIHSPRRRGTKPRKGSGGKRYAPGSYAKSWNTRITVNTFSVYEKTTYNRTHYRLTHLLEKGHDAKNGKRVAPIEHIAPLERKAVKNYETRIIKLIKSIK